MFWPIMIGTAAEKVTAPVEQSACKIPTLAELDCSTAVSTAPAITPSTGFLKLRNSCINHGSSARGLIAEDIMPIPVIKMAKPSIILPTPRRRSLPKVYSQMPIKPRMGLHALGLSIWVITLSPSKPESESSQPVTVVPTLAPIMTPMA